ncbi:MAG: hypothetical protein GQ527_04895 [Bacteroidales bacterium]|nr:hypothetical protein [Bacteroidales bacterium]
MGIIFLISLLFFPAPMAILWLKLFVLVILTFIISVPRKFYNTKTLGAIISLPKGFFLMFLSLLKIKGANQKFLHTKNTSSGTNIKDIKNQNK